MRPQPHEPAGISPLLGALLLAVGVGSCGSGGSGGAGGGGAPGAQSQALRLLGLSIADNATLPLNAELRLSFSAEVDFATVSSTSISIAQEDGTGASGSFAPLMLDTDGDGLAETPDRRVVCWQPSCPILPDLSDAGLQPGGDYSLRLRGTDSGAAMVVRAVDGTPLLATTTRRFRTPDSTELEVLFEDRLAGGPQVLIRRPGDLREEGVSFVELGGSADPGARLFFERSSASEASVVIPGPRAAQDVRVPLNLYADAGTGVVFQLELNQPVNPSSSNLSKRFVQLEYLVAGAGATWTPLGTRVSLLRNCVGSGTALRLQSIGALPADSQVRAVLRAGFQGLGGILDATLVDQDAFAIVRSQAIDHVGLQPPGLGADGVLEEFDVGGAGDGSLEDVDAELVIPAAVWGQGGLASSLNFPGIGGLGEDFDWIVQGNPESFDTSAQTIIGGPGGMRSYELFTVGGVVHVHDFIILPRAALRVTGPNPLVVNATGEIRIEGILDLSGFSARDVATLNTGSQPETGGAGAAGGGAGGGSSSVRGNSTPRGDRGQSPFDGAEGGGIGGESGYGYQGLPAGNRRPGGGGGGRFAADQSDLDAAGNAGPLPSAGMTARRGGRGHPDSEGARTRVRPAPGGRDGAGPFVDGRADNDFLGLRADTQVAILADGSAPVLLSQGAVIPGELDLLHAGYGGGGGGDAIFGPGFPTPDWGVNSDEKGGGGGGGGGALRLRSLGPLRFVGLSSRILCRGGGGATGESRLGGIGGSGSGGHVVLESASRISFELPPVAQRPASSRRHVFIDARGAAGRLGPLDAISQGGEGGPGVIQLHVPDALSPPHEDPALSDLLLPVGTIEELDAGDSNALNEVMRPAGIQLLSSFGALSGAQSRWIDLRTAGVKPDSSRSLVRFLFEGIDPADGSLRTLNGRVAPQPALLAGVVDGTQASFLGSDRLRLHGPALQGLISSSLPVSLDLYLRTPLLLKNSILRMTPAVGTALGFIIQGASYDALSQTLELQVASSAGILLGELAQAGAAPGFELIPRFFGVSTAGTDELLPDDHSVRISFEGARADSNGQPDEGALLVEQTSDLSDFEALGPGLLDFIRFKVEFDLDVQGAGVNIDTPTVRLDFLRLPFVY